MRAPHLRKFKMWKKRQTFRFIFCMFPLQPEFVIQSNPLSEGYLIQSNTLSKLFFQIYNSIQSAIRTIVSSIYSEIKFLFFLFFFKFLCFGIVENSNTCCQQAVGISKSDRCFNNSSGISKMVYL